MATETPDKFGGRLRQMMIRCAALLLSAAVAGAPMVADYCTVACEAAHSHRAAATGEEPSDSTRSSSMKLA